MARKRGDTEEFKDQRLEALAGIIQGFELKLEKPTEKTITIHNMESDR